MSYGAFLYNENYASKTLQKKFGDLYYKCLRNTIGLGKRSNREKILYHLGIPSDQELTEISLLTVIKRWD